MKQVDIAFAEARVSQQSVIEHEWFCSDQTDEIEAYHMVCFSKRVNRFAEGSRGETKQKNEGPIDSDKRTKLHDITQEI